LRTAFEDRFWSRVDAQLFDDQQRRDARARISLSTIFTHEQGLVFVYRKIGSFYRWRAGDPNIIHSINYQEDAQLPGEYKWLVVEEPPASEAIPANEPAPAPAPTEPASP
jgi:hypothetical protein